MNRSNTNETRASRDVFHLWGTGYFIHNIYIYITMHISMHLIVALPCKRMFVAAATPLTQVLYNFQGSSQVRRDPETSPQFGCDKSMGWKVFLQENFERHNLVKGGDVVFFLLSNGLSGATDSQHEQLRRHAAGTLFFGIPGTEGVLGPWKPGWGWYRPRCPSLTDGSSHLRNSLRALRLCAPRGNKWIWIVQGEMSTASGVDTPRKLVFGWPKTHLKSFESMSQLQYISTAPIWQLSYLSRTSELPKIPCVLTFAAYLPQLNRFNRRTDFREANEKACYHHVMKFLNDSYCVRRNFSEGFRAQLPSIAWWIPWRCNQPLYKGK